MGGVERCMAEHDEEKAEDEKVAPFAELVQKVSDGY